jgi:tetratricopeptide repeat protein 21B
LKAIILCDQGQIQEATTTLQQAVSNNFAVKEHPIYLLVKATIELKNNTGKEAAKTLEMALEAPGVRMATAKQAANKTKAVKPTESLRFALTLEDRASIFLHLADCNADLGRFPEAKKLIQNCIVEFKKSTQEMRIVIANSNLSLKSGDVKAALNLLKNIKNDNPQFLKARRKMADI